MKVKSNEKQVTYRQICPDVYLSPLKDVIAGKIESGIFFPYGSVASYFF